MIGRRTAVLALPLALLAACSKATPPDEVALRAEDKRDLEQLVAIDVRTSRAMQEADQAMQTGDAGAAADAVARRARPAAEEAIRAAEAAAMRTPWGKIKRQELLAVLQERRAEMPKYEEALGTGDPEKMLAAIVAQAAIERRALATVAAIEEGR